MVRYLMQLYHLDEALPHDIKNKTKHSKIVVLILIVIYTTNYYQ